jgi:hypothetical protein
MQKSKTSTLVDTRTRPRVFIGSSTEGLEVARALQSALYYDSEPVIWSQGVFGLSGGTLETLVAECDQFDFAVFVLSADDLIERREQSGNVPRDNVLFELGLFMGRLGRDRTFFVHCRTDKLLIPTDLAGVTAASYLPPSEPRYIHAALSVATSPILSAVQTLGLRENKRTLGTPRSNELDELRAQVSEMRIVLSSFAAYAQKLPSAESKGGDAEKQLAGETGLEVLAGTWEGDPTDSAAWCFVKDGTARFLYCYRGSGAPTGEYYDWERTGNTLCGKFRWFDDESIHGYAWFEIVGDELLRGGWWMHDSVPDKLVPKLPHVPNMVPLKWHKMSSSVNSKAKVYFSRRDLKV